MSEQANDKNPNWIQKIGKRKFLWLFFGGLLGFALLLLGNSDILEKMQAAEPNSITPQEELALYQESVEEDVCRLCQSVSGVGKVTASVTLSGGFSSVYAMEEDEQGEHYVILGSGSSASALLICKEPPQILGIGVVCEGGENPAIKNELTLLLCATYHLSSTRIYIAGSK